ncbi:MAG: nucleotidyltransferase family protein [Acidobacteria bacterium]|nr:nucleotidyltransferase family protein [Acidobacteriota bacterium]
MLQNEIVAVVLAAGESSRMGFPKPLLPLGSSTFLGRLLNLYDAVGITVWVVLGHRQQEILSRFNWERVHTTINPAPSRGQLSSLQVALAEIPPVSAIILHPVDYPMVQLDTVRALVSFHRRVPHCIVLPRCEGRRGHPVLFPARFFPDLRHAPLEKGARSVVHSNAASVHLIDVADPGVYLDIDTTDQYQELRRKYQL